jgi:hypothetical protein
MRTVKIYLNSGNIITIENCGGVKVEFQYIPHTASNIVSNIVWIAPLPPMHIRSISLHRIEAITEEDS